MSLYQKTLRVIKKLIKFYIAALKDIDKEYNLVLENIIFLPKYNREVPIIRLIGSSCYIIEPAEAIIQNSKYKLRLHPDDLLKINKLAHEQQKDSNVKITRQDITGDIYLSNGEVINIHKHDLDKLDLDKIFSLPEQDILALLEQRGFNKGRAISQEITELKNKKAIKQRGKLKLIS